MLDQRDSLGKGQGAKGRTAISVEGLLVVSFDFPGLTWHPCRAPVARACTGASFDLGGTIV